MSSSQRLSIISERTSESEMSNFSPIIFPSFRFGFQSTLDEEDFLIGDSCYEFEFGEASTPSENMKILD
jgi:hypothetical protein